MKINSFLKLFKSAKNQGFRGRYFAYPEVEKYLGALPGHLNLKNEGQSVLGRAIYSLEMGSGSLKVLLWSQMHGNETTTTKAVLDLINMCHEKTEHPLVKSIFENCRIKILPVVNPDGAQNFRRTNANNIDLNRDALKQTQPESEVLQRLVKNFKPDFCFNLHDQRTIFGVHGKTKPATLSFLSPAFNAKRDIDPVRKTAMQLIAGINVELQKHIPDQIGRYDDKFNLNCTGDFFQSKKIPTLLVEAGHYPQDYDREKTRKYVFLALCHSFQSIITKSYKAFKVSAYFKIPENRKEFYDIIIRKAKINNAVVDVAIQYDEKLSGNHITFVPKIVEIKNLDGFYGHKEIFANREELECFPCQKLNKGSVVERIAINNKITPLTLTNN